MVIKMRGKIRWIAQVIPISLTVDHVDVYEVGPRIDFVGLAQLTTAAHCATPDSDLAIDPYFVGINRPLSERMTEANGPEHHFKKVLLSPFQSRNLRTQRSDQFAVDRPPFFDTE